MCHFVTNNGSGDEQKYMFENPDDLMKNHLKPLFIQAKVYEIGINKVFVDGGAAVSLMPQSLLKRIGKTDKDLKLYNKILSNYEGKVGHSLGALQVSLTVSTVVRQSLFIVVPLKANFNLLLGREWVHGIGVVPSSMNQRISIWRDDGTVENIEDDQSYFLAKLNHITRKTFDKSLADASSVRLHPTHCFT